MTGRKKNLSASVAARLLNRAKQAGDDYQTLLPILDDVHRGAPCSGTWPPGGPWGGPKVER